MTGWSSKPDWPSAIIAVDHGGKDQSVYGLIVDGNFEQIGENEFKSLNFKSIEVTEKVYNNKMPTHDPYTNPNAQVYYECKCGAILDPGTKSFASLNNAASDKGWKVRWKQNGEGYEPFCVECGKDVE